MKIELTKNQINVILSCMAARIRNLEETEGYGTVATVQKRVFHILRNQYPDSDIFLLEELKLKSLEESKK